jgi:hypothetical protein
VPSSFVNLRAPDRHTGVHSRLTGRSCGLAYGKAETRGIAVQDPPPESPLAHDAGLKHFRRGVTESREQVVAAHLNAQQRRW